MSTFSTSCQSSPSLPLSGSPHLGCLYTHLTLCQRSVCVFSSVEPHSDLLQFMSKTLSFTHPFPPILCRVSHVTYIFIEFVHYLTYQCCMSISVCVADNIYVNVTITHFDNSVSSNIIFLPGLRCLARKAIFTTYNFKLVNSTC